MCLNACKSVPGHSCWAAVAVGLVLPECRWGVSLLFLSRNLEQVSKEEDSGSRGSEVPCVWHSVGPKEELSSRTNNAGQLISMYYLL